ncbi:MAG TPA: patatin-like phospholipase family protein [Mycobacteriales bacterium]|nr:patatin-like phospholipase family protein [Mycobacteriales bacterium]
MSFALVLGAGGQAGEAFHRGVLRALHDVGLDARDAAVVVGTSAGSITAASLRRHAPAWDVSALPRPTRRRLLPLRTRALELVRRPRQVLNAFLLAPEFATGRISSEFMRTGLAGRYAAWPKAPLWIVAVRRSDGRRVVFGKAGEPTADVPSAVAASCAIPGYFSPVEIDGTAYVDGGVHSPTNADLVADAGVDVVIVSAPMSVRLRGARPRLDLGLRLVFSAYLREEVWTLRRRRDTHVVTVEPDAMVLSAMGLNLMDGRRVHEVEERAYTLARHALRDLPLARALRRPA